jgi:hypothetical protein
MDAIGLSEDARKAVYMPETSPMAAEPINDSTINRVEI